MNRTSGYLIGAIVLIVIGVLLLLQNLQVIQGLEELFWTLAFIAAGVAFLANFATAPKLRWWSVIPGMVLLGIGLLIGLEQYMGDWAGGLFLGAIAIAFWLIYFTQREFWWAVIPAGVLTTLTAIIGFENVMDDTVLGGVFFLGLGVTFLLVLLLPSTESTRWAIWPAGVLLVMGIILVAASTAILSWIWAVALIAGGLYLVVRALMNTTRAPKQPAVTADDLPIDFGAPPVAPPSVAPPHSAPPPAPGETDDGQLSPTPPIEDDTP
jgi:hypothetical protein